MNAPEICVKQVGKNSGRLHVNVPAVEDSTEQPLEDEMVMGLWFDHFLFRLLKGKIVVDDGNHCCLQRPRY